MEQGKPINSTQTEMVKIEVIRKFILRSLVIFMLVFNVFLFLRIVLRLVGADPQTLFAGLIFIISGIFLIPFFGMFPQFKDEIIAGKATLDALAVIALFCTNILILLSMAITQIGSTMIRTNRQAKDTVEKKRTVDTAVVDQSVR